MNRPDENEDKFDHDPDGTGWEVNTNEMTPKHMRDIPRRIRCLPFDVPWSQKTADSLAEEVALVVEMALLPPNAGADIAAKAGTHAALANLERALKAEARIEALEKELRDYAAGLIQDADSGRISFGQLRAIAGWLERKGAALALLSPYPTREGMTLAERLMADAEEGRSRT